MNRLIPVITYVVIFIAFVSCRKDTPGIVEDDSSIIGTWEILKSSTVVTTQTDGEITETENQDFASHSKASYAIFKRDSTFESERYFDNNSGNLKSFKENGTYSIEGDKIILKTTDASGIPNSASGTFEIKAGQLTIIMIQHFLTEDNAFTATITSNFRRTS